MNMAWIVMEFLTATKMRDRLRDLMSITTKAKGGISQGQFWLIWNLALWIQSRLVRWATYLSLIIIVLGKVELEIIGPKDITLRVTYTKKYVNKSTILHEFF